MKYISKIFIRPPRPMSPKCPVTLIIALALFATLTSCEDLLDPRNDNHRTYDYPATEVATDNAVSNYKTNNYLRAATGQWTSIFDPMSRWASCQSGILSVNQFLAIVDSINWKQSIPQVNNLYIRRFKGESYGLRALLRFYLLETVAGEDANGNLAGIPLFNGFLPDMEKR